MIFVSSAFFIDILIIGIFVIMHISSKYPAQILGQRNKNYFERKIMIINLNTLNINFLLGQTYLFKMEENYQIYFIHFDIPKRQKSTILPITGGMKRKQNGKKRVKEYR